MIKKALVIMVGLAFMGLVGCSQDEPKTAVDKAKESMHDAGVATKEAAHDAASATKEMAHDAKKAVE
ncbi:MAG: hypothetical protein JRC69_05770 [Deltaproteobacteria bacterium]|nr:hypothetical protein [Deltaproteobacteria bacterium]